MARMTLDDFASQLRAALGDDLVSLLLYGSAARDPAAGSREPDAANTLLLLGTVARCLDRITGAAARRPEHELMGKLVPLGQACEAGWGKPKRLAEIVRTTRAGFLTMLRAVMRLADGPVPADAALVRDAAGLIG